MSTLSSTEAFEFCSKVYEELEEEGKTLGTTIDDMAKAIAKVAPHYSGISIPTVNKKKTLESFSGILALASFDKKGKGSSAENLSTMFTQLSAFGELSEKARYTARIGEKRFSGETPSSVEEFLLYMKEAIASAEFSAYRLTRDLRHPILEKLSQARGLLESCGTQKLENVHEKLQEAKKLADEIIVPKTPTYLTALQGDLARAISELSEFNEGKDPMETAALIIKRKGYTIEKTILS